MDLHTFSQIQQLDKLLSAQSSSFSDALSILLTKTNSLFGERVAIWQNCFDPRCPTQVSLKGLYVAENEQVESNFAVLCANHCPPYFDLVTNDELDTIQYDKQLKQNGYQTIAYFDEHDIHSAIAIPFYKNGRVVGLLSVESSDGQKRWQPSDFVLAQQVIQLYQKLEYMQLEQQSQRVLESEYSNPVTLDQVIEHTAEYYRRETLAQSGNMILDLAHQINTPIGVAVTATSAMSDKIDNLLQAFLARKVTNTQLLNVINQNKEGLELTQTSLDKVAKIIDQLKLSSSDHLNFSIQLVNVYQWLLEMKESMLQQYAGLDFVIACAKETAIRICRGALEQVLIQLVKNSVEHSRCQNHKLTISVDVWICPDNKSVTLRYSDNGEGMSPAISEQALRPFFTTKGNKSNLGLGLNIIENYATKALGGEITIESADGAGVEIELCFPLIGSVEFDNCEDCQLCSVS